MNELRKNRVALILVLAGLLAAAIFYVFYLPTRGQIVLRRTEINSLQQEIDGLTEFLRSADAANHFAETLAGERTATLNELYSVDSLAAFMDDFKSTLEAAGLSNIYVSPVIDELLSPPTIQLDGVTLARLRFEVEAQGEFINGGRALEGLERQRYYVAVPSLSIEHDDGIAPEVAWNFQLLAHFRTGGPNGG